MLQHELRRAFHNKLFVISLAIAIIIALLHVLLVSLPYGLTDTWESWRSGAKGIYPPSLYNTWIGQTGYSVFTVAFYFAIPLLCCIAYADSLCTDISTKYINQELIRSSRTRYFSSKIIAVSLSCGCIACIPLLINLALTACFVPALIPEPTAGTFFVAPNTMLADLYYDLPLVYILVFMILTLILSGVFGLIALACSFFVRNHIVVTLMPFAFCMAIQFVSQDSIFAGFSPINILLPYQPYPSLFWVIALILIVLICGLTAMIICRGKRYEDL